MARSQAGDLRERLLDPGFTPAAADVPALLALLEETDRELGRVVERVLARAGVRAVEPALEQLAAATPEARAKITGLLGRLGDERAAPVLRAALDDPEPRVRRRAASALGRLPADPETERSLLRAFEGGDLPAKRAIAESLGKIGGRAAADALAREGRGDPELARRIGNALALIDRRSSRDQTSRVVLDRELGEPVVVLVRCRAGLSHLLLEELAGLGRARRTSDSLVELRFGGTLAKLLGARIALELGVRVPLEPGPDLALAVSAALGTPAARRVFSRWTEGTPRFRVAFTDGRHRRATSWSVARLVSKEDGLINDPRGASWEVVVVHEVDEPHLVLVPRGFDDPRFDYRKRDVPAASHPTIAAALARTAGVRSNDVVWDPFVGSGLELVERAKLGAYRRLVGTDLDERALGAARENLAAAKVHAELVRADARSYRPEGVTLIVTNPPMGRRLARDRSLGPLLEGFLSHAASVLVPGGRLTLLDPLPELTRRIAPSLDLELQAGPPVDLGGFTAELETLRKQHNRSRR
jgi:predicted RNA methylase